MQNRVVTGEVVKAGRRNNTREGNPVWTVSLHNGDRYTTKRDAQVGHDVAQEWVGKWVRLDIEDDRIRYAEIITPQEIASEI